MFRTNVFSTLFFWTLLYFVFSQSEDQKHRVRLEEQEIRRSHGMAYTNSETFSFVSNSMDDYFIENTENQEVKGDIVVFWRIDGTYVPPQYTFGQQIRLLIYDYETSKVLSDRTFYIETGFAFQAQKGKKYLIRFITNGNYIKLMSVTFSKLIVKTEGLADAKDLHQSSGRTQALMQSLRTLIQISERNNMFTNQISSAIFGTTKSYKNFGIFEAIVIIAISILQVTYISRLMKTTSIV